MIFKLRIYKAVKPHLEFCIGDREEWGYVKEIRQGWFRRTTFKVIYNDGSYTRVSGFPYITYVDLKK